MLSHPAAIKALSPGRVVVIDHNSHKNTLGVVLKISLGTNNERTFTCLVICDKNSSENEQNVLDQDLVSATTNLTLFQPEGPCQHDMVDCKAEAISVVTTKTLRIEADRIMNDVKKRQQPRFR